MSSPTAGARLFLLLQYALPRYWMTRCVYRLTRVRSVAIKNLLIRRFVDLFRVDVSEARHAVPDGYATFNDFFTRELRAGVRPIDDAADSIVSPVDGTLSAWGDIDDDRIYQAKGKSYTLSDLLAVDLDAANAFRGGQFATVYLAPYNYHRVHAPFAGTLTALSYVPGDLFSVNKATVQLLPGLFARNERLVCRFATASGPAVVVFVGALNVGSITTPWTGEIRPRRDGMVESLPLAGPVDVARGELLGWFNMGSTVIVLTPPATTDWTDEFAPEKTLIVGQRIGRWRTAPE